MKQSVNALTNKISALNAQIRHLEAQIDNYKIIMKNYSEERRQKIAIPHLARLSYERDGLVEEVIALRLKRDKIT